MLVGAANNAFGRNHGSRKLTFGMGHTVRQHRLCQRQPDWHYRRIASNVSVLAILMVVEKDRWKITTKLDQRVPVITKDGKIALVRPQSKRCLPNCRVHRVAKIQL